MKVISIILMLLSGVFLIALQWKPWAWIIWMLGVVSLKLGSKKFARDMLLIFIAIALLGLTPITTDVSPGHMGLMGLTLMLAIAIPYLISHKIYRSDAIRFRWHHGRKWLKKEIFYVIFTLVVSYFLIPFYLSNTGAYQNWSVEPGADFIGRLFIGTNALGIWDELFFISTVLGLLRKHMKFIYANLAQTVLFTAFLFELGFTGWGPVMIFPFALLQGQIFRKTESLFYIITIHLVIDLVLFLALIHAHHPSWMPIFL